MLPFLREGVEAADADVEPVRRVRADDAVRPLADDEHVGAVAADQRVVAGAAVEGVGACAAVERVVAEAAEQRVVAVIAVDLVVALVAVDDVVAGVGVDDLVLERPEQVLAGTKLSDRFLRLRAGVVLVAALDDVLRKIVGLIAGELQLVVDGALFVGPEQHPADTARVARRAVLAGRVRPGEVARDKSLPKFSPACLSNDSGPPEWPAAPIALGSVQVPDAFRYFPVASTFRR